MPFNGSGTYTLPAGNPVVTNTPISSTTTNNTNNDIANALTNCLTRDGQSSPTSAIPMSNQKLTGLAKGTIAGDAMRFEQTAQIDETTGENSNIKSITGLTTPLSAAQGGSGASSATGTGSNVLSNSPSLVTPALGTPTSGNLSNCTFPTLNQNTTGTAAKATNVAGGTAGRVLYQYGVDTTSFTDVGTTGQFLKSNGTSAPSWASLSGTYATLGANTFTADQIINNVQIGGGISSTSNLGIFIGYNINTLANTYGPAYAVAIGTDVGAASYCVAVGAKALTANTVGNGYFNTAVGYMAGTAVTSGNNITLIGSYSGKNLTTGAGNTLIGYSAGADAVANLTTQSNYVVIGNNSTTNANIKVAWTVTSDARDKTNFAEIPHGLDFVVQLKPTAYQFKLDRNSDDVGENARVRYGFLAQDVLDLEGTNPVIINNDDLEHLKYNESSMIPVLVKAIQELTDKVTALESRIV